MTTLPAGHARHRIATRRRLTPLAATGLALAALVTAMVAATGPADAATAPGLAPGVVGHTWHLARIQSAGQDAAAGSAAVLAVPRSGPVTLGTGCATVTRTLTVPAPHRFALTGGGPVRAMCTRTGQPVQDAVLTAFSGPVSYSVRRDGTLRVTGHGETLVYRKG